MFRKINKEFVITIIIIKCITKYKFFKGKLIIFSQSTLFNLTPLSLKSAL